MNCDICNKKLKVRKSQIVGGKVLLFREGDKEYERLRCNECYKKDQSLHGYQKCEVYSRVVGYLRPTSQWNLGKQKEFKDRVEYKI